MNTLIVCEGVWKKMRLIPFSPYNRLRFYCIQSNTFILRLIWHNLNPQLDTSKELV